MKNPRGPGDAREKRRVARLAAVAAVTFALTTSACQTEPAAEKPFGASTDAVGPPAASTDAGAPVPGSGGDEAIDACTLLTEAEVTPVIGANDGGTGGGASTKGSGCSWENPETYHSITVSIGAAGTAASGQLPAESDYGATEPGPDGIRFAPGNIAEFVVDDRLCEIQVVTSVTTEKDRPTVVRLIGLIRERV